jgi:hypothetical protein
MSTLRLIICCLTEITNIKRGHKHIKKVSVESDECRPKRIFDMLLDDKGDAYIEIKIRKNQIIKIKMNEHLSKLGFNIN